MMEEGSLSEELMKSMEEGADASQGGTSECLRVKRKSLKKKKNKKKKHLSSRNWGTMEGTESEELKLVTRGSDASQESSECLRGVKCKRVNKKKKRASRMEEGADASQGTSECLRVKHKSFSKKKKKKRPSSRNSGTMEGTESEELKSVKRGADASQESSECLRVVKKKKKKKRASRMEEGADASQGTSESLRVKRKSLKKRKKKKKKKRLGGSDRHLVKQKKTVDEDSFPWLQRCTSNDACKGKMAAGSSKHHQVRKEDESGLFEHLDQMDLRDANMVLEFYEKSQDGAEFEISKILYITDSELQLPEHENDPEFDRIWSHVCFIAKPKDGDCNVSPKYFFGEFYRGYDSGEYHVTYCSTFQPSDDPEFDHGCLFCPPGEKFHPSDGDFVARPPWFKPEVIYADPPWVKWTF